ncbi:tetratricopeptide repeat protein [Caulobacter sp. 17J65-9]|uniref:tetratricopeptide repeat protein n=1 Tax=Caulobacter sp. 17J65-9 TaxID=2709382 RepID=UPI0013C73165|nr:tetratricopeptide repeat protein [Caulobacter sp. 17J65-9]NEX94967.1 tetratricopeptide repeat protein [Caulobacter sp. 17J65-9]
MTDIVVPPDPPASRPTTPGTLDPIELALEAEAEALAPSNPARLVLLRHARLLQRQIASETLSLGLLRRQIASETVSLGLKALAGVAALGVAGLLGMLVWDASTERGLVIEPFSVPPELAERGLTGQVVASKVLDRLSELQDATISNRSPTTYANNWNGDIKVQIPETGVSVGELRRVLVQWLGRQTSISGEVYRTPEGLVVAARTGAAAARPHAGTEAELDALIQAAAEDVFAVTQPYRYAVWLGQAGDEESLRRADAVLQRLIVEGDDEDRLWAHNGLSIDLIVLGDSAGAIREADAAIAVEPRFGLAWINRGDFRQAQFGHSEAALADYQTAQRLIRDHGERYYRPEALAFLTSSVEGSIAELTGDYASGARAFNDVVRHPGREGWLYLAVSDQAAGHDLAAARAGRSRVAATPADADAHQRALDAQAAATMDMAIAEQTEDWTALLNAIAGVPEADLLPGEREAWRLQATPHAALGRAKQGDLAGARALIATTPLDCHPCVRARGGIASTAGDWAGADHWFGQAVRQAPSLPFAYAQWGESLMARGRYDAAIARFKQAAEKGPRWADPLELWGEALLKKGDWAGAVGQFAAADKLAPKWGRNHLRWGEALLKLGRRQEARAHLSRARALDLSAADQAVLARLEARPG